ncbi:MAG: tetratricopeptide repeat protein [Bacteroidetes bacterium]|nr:tetratricopeptide repeat protein [Bacteroidota bacterium]
MTKQKRKPINPIPVKTIIKKDYTSYWLIAGLLLTLIVYFPSLTNGITNWDDNKYIDNPYVKDLSLAGIVKIFSVYVLGNYHPLTLLSLGIDRLIGGGNPFIFHFTNLLLHLFNTFLVFLLVKRLTQNNLLAILTFMLFGIHTLHVESVAWVSERKDVLYSFFFLVSLIFYTKYVSGRKTVYYGLSLLLFFLSLLSKGQAVILVAILPFIDYLKGRKWLSTKVLSEKIPFLLLSLIFGWVAFRAQQSASALHFEYYTLPERFAFAFFGFAQYLIKSIAPVCLSAFYPYPQRLLNGCIPLSYWLFIIPLPVYLIGSYFLVKRSKIYAFGLSMFLLNLLPVLQIIPFGGAIIADRYFYIPSIGLLLCFAFGLLEIRNTKIRYALVISFILIFSSLSFSRCMVWKDSLTLWDDAISKYDYAKVAYSNRGIVYGNLGQWDKAIADFSRAIELDNKYLEPHYNRGLAYCYFRKWDKATADFSQTIGIDPEFAPAYSNRGYTYNNLGQWDKSIADCSKAIEIDPKLPDTYFYRGFANFNIGQLNKAITDFSKAIEIDPKYTDAYYNRGVAYYSLEQKDRSIADFTKVIGIDPNYKSAYYNRGVAYNNLGQWDKAIADFSKAIEIDPNYSDAYFNRDLAYRKLHSEKRR